MEHPREIELIELAAGRVDAQREEAIRGHIRQCPQCREKFEGLRQTWDILGAWEVRPPEQLASAEVLLASEPEKDPLRGSVVRLFDVRVALRIAAALVLTTVVGYTSGRWSVRGGPAGSRMEPPQYLSALELDIGDSLSSLLFYGEPLPAEEG